MTLASRRIVLSNLAALGAAVSIGALLGACATPGQAPLQLPVQGVYYPPAGDWARVDPARLGIDPVRLREAVAFAQAHETEREKDFSDQRKTFGEPLGSLPSKRAATNGLVIYKGYVVAEFGDTHFVDPTYSVAKSMLSTVAAIAVRDGKIADLDQPVGQAIKDGGYASPHNASITWKHHLQQESEWEGSLWGKNADFVGHDAFGAGERKPRALLAPGTHFEYNDTRINRLSLSLLRLFDKPVPDVFQDEVMDPIGASHQWKWVPYTNSYVDLHGKPVASVSGGTRWGGGMWIDSWDMARFGLLWQRGGVWNGRQILPVSYVKAATTPSEHGPDYGYLFWLNTKGKNLPGLPSTAFAALGAGDNDIVISPENELVVVWRWHAHAVNTAEFSKRVIAALPK
ncbi:serine hydrolase [Massilia sp. 9096]|uniref:serine hydrolase domain-containing protein n=1 Tax=Massilia sp. 9096 TaxID=1500894 RepID=UPI00056CDC53|nr:serine hydrolase [Massilia sp. 9096]